MATNLARSGRHMKFGIRSRIERYKNPDVEKPLRESEEKALLIECLIEMEKHLKSPGGRMYNYHGVIPITFMEQMMEEYPEKFDELRIISHAKNAKILAKIEQCLETGERYPNQIKQTMDYANDILKKKLEEEEGAVNNSGFSITFMDNPRDKSIESLPEAKKIK